MEFNDVKKLISDGPSMSFVQIAEVMGITPSGVRHLYVTALQKLRNNMTEEQKNEIQELLAEPEDTTYETMLEAWALQQDRGLTGFWNEKENV